MVTRFKGDTRFITQLDLRNMPPNIDINEARCDFLTSPCIFSLKFPSKRKLAYLETKRSNSEYSYNLDVSSL